MAYDIRNLSYGRSASIVIIEDNTFIRSSIVSLLRREFAGWHIVSMTSVDEAVKAIACPARLVVIGTGAASFDDAGTRAAIAVVKRAFPRADLAVLVEFAGTDLAVEGLKLGVRGVFAKSQPVEAMIAAMRIVLAGGVYCPRQQEWAEDRDADPGLLLAEDDAGFAARPVSATFTPRENEVLDELQLGRSNKVIAAELGLSENTVKMHIQRIMRKLGVQNRTEIVVRLARRNPLAGAAAPARA